jgi:hypothetical protein
VAERKGFELPVGRAPKEDRLRLRWRLGGDSF